MKASPTNHHHQHSPGLHAHQLWLQRKLSHEGQVGYKEVSGPNPAQELNYKHTVPRIFSHQGLAYVA